MNLMNKINNARIIACCGSGGVGKTTIAATLGLHGALSGRKTLVLTIDPAKRLADSLGLTSFEQEQQRVPDEKFREAGLQPKGELYAMMLDTKRTFDHLIKRYASNEKMRNSIIENRYYRHISGTLSGSHEYMAMEKLYEIYRQDKYDLIVLDTPPSRNALDFLDAPRRLDNLLGNNLFRRVVKPYAGSKVLSFFTSPVQKIIGMIFGKQVMDDLFDFFQLGTDVFLDGFQQRSAAVRQVLEGPETLFFAIASPMEAPMNEAIFLHEKLKENNMPFGGFIVNRVHSTYTGSLRFGSIDKQQSISPELKKKLADNFTSFRNLARNDENALEKLGKIAGPNVQVKQIPYFEKDVYDFPGLIQVYDYLSCRDRNELLKTGT